MKGLKLPLSIALLLVLLSSCSQRIMDFTLISTKNVDLSKMSSFTKGDKRVTGEDRCFYIYTIPTRIVSIKAAIDKTIEATPGCVALVDGVVSSKFWTIVLIGKGGYVVEGTPLIDKTVKTSYVPSKYNHCTLDKNGNMQITSVTKDEFESKKNLIKFK